VHVTGLVWTITLVAIALIFVIDFLVLGRRPHIVGMKEAALTAGVYVAIAAAFGLGVWIIAGGQYGAEFFAGYVTELSLSVDNLFVFSVILTSFAVPRLHQLKVLQFGIIGALLLRFAFILVGAAALNYFSWLFFVFGVFLIWTAWKLATSHGAETDPDDSKVLKWAQKILPTTTQYDEGRLRTRIDGKKLFTPLAIVMVSIFVTDIMFALDSIPAIFGLTQEAYIVFTANAFALMGLRQMYFLLDGLLDKLIYLSLGLSVVLGFIGVKLFLHAGHEYGWAVPDISTPVSLIVIVLTLVVTVLASLAKVRKNPEVLETHDVTGHHHPGGESLRDLAEHGNHPVADPAQTGENPPGSPVTTPRE
jgi:tellurite resistance protein TerC